MARVPSQWLFKAISVSMRAVTVASTVRSGAETDSRAGMPNNRLAAIIRRMPHSASLLGDGDVPRRRVLDAGSASSPSTPRSSTVTPGPNQVRPISRSRSS